MFDEDDMAAGILIFMSCRIVCWLTLVHSPSSCIPDDWWVNGSGRRGSEVSIVRRWGTCEVAVAKSRSFVVVRHYLRVLDVSSGGVQGQA
jgi:hypothetical protein